jgi:hypothetical protein
MFGIEFHRDTGDLLPRSVTLHLSPSRTLTQIDMEASPLLRSARTDEDYLRSKIYDETLLALGKRCSVLETPNALFRFFHNSVKPTLSVSAKPDEEGVRGRTFFSGSSAWAKLCDANVRMEEASTWTAGIMHREKYQGDIYGLRLIFK